MSRKGHAQNKFVRFITIPFRALGKARDLYVRSMTSCAAGVSFGQGGGAADYAGQLPRSFSESSAASSYANEDFRDLIRAASVRSLGHRNEVEMFLQEQLKQMRAAKGLPKSSSVGMGRIDEDKPFESEEKNQLHHVDNNAMKQDTLFKRSKTYAVTKRSSDKLEHGHHLLPQEGPKYHVECFKFLLMATEVCRKYCNLRSLNYFCIASRLKLFAICWASPSSAFPTWLWISNQL
ncbi:hypothetical protein V6N13_049167 [Hibiscus sabdariffa]|uniref:Uncharacterized protein n=1 Tax=Hibiscus sabdariffa TaxID=183260 RepID=A0ABR2QXZ5_9ROSI